MPRWWPLLLAFTIIVASGIAHGLCSERWAASPKVQQAVDRLPGVPKTIGDWEGQDIDNDVAEKHRADIQGALQRRYGRGSGKGEVIVALVCGRSGPISVHTPDVCYQGAGFRMVGEPTKHLVPAAGSGEPAAFWKASFVKETFPVREELRIYWSWNAGSGWQIAKEPRLAFARFPVLHKLYAIYRVPQGSTAADPCPEFLRQFLPEVNGSLFAVE
jgi:uncharacterized protein DUF3485